MSLRSSLIPAVGWLRVISRVRSPLPEVSATYELETFLDRPHPVELVSRLTEVTQIGRQVRLRCATTVHEPALQDYYGTRVETAFGPARPGDGMTLWLDFCTAEIVRLRASFSSDGSMPQSESLMVVGRFDEDDFSVELREDETDVLIATDGLRLVIAREPFSIAFQKPGGQPITATRAPDIAGLGLTRAGVDTDAQRWIFFNRYAYPLGRTLDERRQTMFLSLELGYDEHLHGLGEVFGDLDRRETSTELWIQEAFSNSSAAAYKRVPFLISSRGYGLFLNTTHATRVRAGDLDHTALSLILRESKLLDLYFIAGDGPSEILRRYHSITGAPAVPPLWSFGLWMGRITYRAQAEVEEVAAELRRRQLPCDVIHIDTGWFDEEYVCDWEFSAERFPDPAGMCARLAEQGFRVSLWQWPNLAVHSPLFNEALNRGFLAQRSSGHTYLAPGGYDEDAGYLDFSNPEAVRWFQAKIAALLELGVAAIKVDYGEGAQPQAVHAGIDSAAVHNAYPLLYARAVFEETERVHGAGQGVIWGRSAWAGSQRYPVHWSGDGVARFEDLACVLRAMLSMGLSGFPFYSHDIGGFAGRPTPELYVRWLQLGCFSSHLRAHGNPPREPWAYGEEAERICRQYLELRMRLLPYIYSHAVAAAETGLPLARAALIDFPGDPAAAALQDAYMFGPDLFVAPVLDERPTRSVYLPPGEWYGWWDKQRVSGGRVVSIEAPLDVVPLWVREGAVLPLGPVRQHTGGAAEGPWTVELYGPTKSGSLRLHQEGADDAEVAYGFGDGRLNVSLSGFSESVEVRSYGAGSAEVRLRRVDRGG